MLYKKDFMKIFKIKRFMLLLLVFLMQLVFIPSPKANAYSNPATVPLGTVSNFAALAHTAVSSPIAGTKLKNGDLGIDAGCTGFPAPCTTPGVGGTVINGVIHNEDGTASKGHTDATAAVSNMSGRSSNQTIAAGLLNGLTLPQGVYTVPAAAIANLTGDLILTGDENSVFIFHVTSTLVTTGGSRVLLRGGVTPCNVYWKVDTSATFNDDTTFEGTVIAGDSVTFPGGVATLDGRVIAQTGAITFNNTTVNTPTCASNRNQSGVSKNTFTEDTRCLDTTPAAPQWAYRYSADGGVNLVWSAMGGTQVDIEIANDKGEYVYKYDKVPNVGHMFLPNVSLSQLIRIRVLNECEYGDWLIAGNQVGLPNTGLGPKDSNILWYIPVSVILGASALLILTRKKHKFSSGH